MSAVITYGRNAMMSNASLSHADGGQMYVFCSIPGGRPWLSFYAGGHEPIRIDGAPQCDTHRQFVEFVTQRFGGPE